MANETTTTPPHGLGQSGPVLCGVAEDPHAPVVVGVAAQLARALAAPLILAHVTLADFPPGISAAAYGQARLLEEQHEHADEFTDNLLLLARLARGRTSNASSAVEHRPKHSSSSHIRNALSCLSSAPLVKDPSGRCLRGSVSHHLSSHAPCPVVIVPPKMSIGTDEDGDDAVRGLPDEASLGLSRTDW